MKFEFNPYTHTYRLNGVELKGVSDILGVSFMTVFYSEVGATKGKDIHKDCENFDKGDRFPLHFKYPAYVEQWSLCLQEKLKLVKTPDIKAFKDEEIEHATWHPKRFYCGTIDREKLNLFRFWIMDLKTGGVNQPRDIIQLHAYFRMRFDRLPLWRKFILKVAGDIKLANIYLKEDGSAVYWYRYDDRIYKYFLAMQDSLEILEKPGKITRFYGE